MIGPNNVSTVAASGARLGAGKGGIYRKEDSKLLYDGSAPNLGIQRILHATIKVPSSRIRVAFGVGNPNPDVTDDGSTGFANSYGNGATVWNAVPYSRQPAAMIAAGQAGDARGLIAGRPIFWMCPSGYGTGTQVDSAAPYFESQASDPVATASAALFSQQPSVEALLNGYKIGRFVPDAYEAQSSVQEYDIWVWLSAGATSQIPLQVWASWEITDPRNQEDTEALLAECSLEATSTRHS